MLRYLTAGESHGKSLSTILEGIPAGLELSKNDINKELARRQSGYGRSQRMRFEEDRVEITSGLRKGKTTGSPLTLIIENKSRGLLKKKTTLPRPGHADLAGVIKYGTQDIRDILERASARETATRVALGAVAKKLLKEFDTEIISHVVRIGKINSKIALSLILPRRVASGDPPKAGKRWGYILKKIETSAVRCLDKKASQEMAKEIEKAKKKGDSLGGIFEVIVTGLPPGLGSHIHWERRLDGRLAQSLMSIPGIKGVEVGLGFSAASKFGSQVQDEIFYNKKEGFYRKTNRAGGIEGGMSNGEWVILRAAMKPIPTLKKPLRSVDLITKKSSWASVERADVCAIPAAGVVAEAVVALEMARAFQEKFGGDSLAEMKRSYKNYVNYVKNI